MSVHVFVGPTLVAQDVLTAVPDAIVHPPAAHGDLLRLDLSSDDTAVVIDGYFHQVPSLRHKEILWILARQVRVIGSGSLGALRAAELEPFGMVGNGVVFEMYRNGDVEADDEVAVAHAEGPEYRKLGTPLVNVRHAAAMAQRHGVVTGPEAAAVVAACRVLHYVARSWRAVEMALARDDPERAEAVGRILGFLVEHPEHADVKASDALDTLSRLDELGRHDSNGVGDWVDPPVWRNRLLYEWCAEFSGSWVDGNRVSDGAVMRFQQIYRPDFPWRWWAFALRGIIGGARSCPARQSDGDVEVEALAVGAEYGIDLRQLTAAQRAEWLTPEEIAKLTPETALLRVLVRTYRSPRGVFDLLSAERDLVTDPAARSAVGESVVVNSNIAGWGPKHSIEYLKADVLLEHLGAVWEADDERSLLAAARDRGFGSLPEAVEAVRPFYLRQHLVAVDPTLATGGSA